MFNLTNIIDKLCFYDKIDKLCFLLTIWFYFNDSIDPYRNSILPVPASIPSSSSLPLAVHSHSSRSRYCPVHHFCQCPFHHTSLCRRPVTRARSEGGDNEAILPQAPHFGKFLGRPPLSPDRLELFGVAH